MKPDQFAKAMKSAAEALRDPKDLLTQIGLVAQGNAARRSPVRTGTLRRSITSRVEGNVAYIGTAVEYAVFVSGGTRYMAARPFLQEGIEDSRPQIERLAHDFGAKVLDKVSRG